jgi:hypothetical protein
MVDRRMKNTAARLGLAGGAIATALVVAIGLSGCIQSSIPLPNSTPTATPSTDVPTATPTPTPTSSPTAQPFVEDCATLLTSDQVYAYNPNYVADPAFRPKAGSISAAIATNAGQTCGWVNETSGSEIEVAVATPTPSALASAKSAASAGTPISAAGEHGFFTVKNGVGSAQFFFGSLWLTVSSSDFAVAADAQALYPTVVQNQLSAGG